MYVQFIGSNRARLQHRLNHALYHGEIEAIVEFNFHGHPHALALTNAYIRIALRLIRNEFDENFGDHGLGRYSFIIGSTLTATVIEYEVSDYGEREHDELEENYDDGAEDENNEGNDRPDPQSRD